MRRSIHRIAAVCASALTLSALAPVAEAQIYWQPPSNEAPAITTPNEAAYSIGLPGATEAEYKAGVVWNLRAALNVAALQCDFEPTLLTTSNYNAMIAHHKDELAKAYAALIAYFKRTGKGANGIDLYNTKIYGGYSTVTAQRNFCSVAGSLGRDAIFADRGDLTAVAMARIPELRRALSPGSEQVFGNPTFGYKASMPSLAENCWSGDKLKKSCQQSWDAEMAARAKN